MNAPGPKPKQPAPKAPRAAAGTPAAPPPPAATGSGVRVQKWQAQAPTGLRTKVCDRCGRTFELAPEEKYFLCRPCYEQEARRQPARKKRGTAILSLIHCAACGAEEYLEFVPPDPAQALCGACFARRRREQKTKPPHSLA